MQIKELQGLSAGKIIYITNIGGKAFGDEMMQNQYFLVKSILDQMMPKIPNNYWTDSDDFGPAIKFILEHIKTKKEFYLIVPLDYEKEEYIYFDNENDDLGDSIPLASIKEYKKEG
jgi:hypothetical protein